MSKQDKQNRAGNQKGAQQHAEGQHGDATIARIQEQSAEQNMSPPGGLRAANDPNLRGKTGDRAMEAHDREMAGGDHDGKHRLFEGRQQHDEADKNSDKNRLIKDVDRHQHDADRFQIPGGRETDGPDDVIRSPRQGGGK